MKRIPVNIKRLIIITCISLLIIGTIIYFTANRETLKSIKNIDKKFFLLGITFYFLLFSFDAIRTKVLIHGTGHKFTLLECYKLVAFSVFFDVITPFSFGGQPFQIYVLHKKNVPGGSATTIVITKLIFGGLVLTGIVIWAIFTYSELFESVPIFQYVVRIVGVLLFISIVLFVSGLYNPKITTGILSFLFIIPWKLRLMRHPDKFKMKIMKHIVLARNSFDGFIGHRFFYFITGLVLSFLMFMSVIFMILCFMWGFNIELDMSTGIALTGSLLFLISFMPTPGASGIGEGIFYLLYKKYIPEHLLGVIIFLWRFFHQYCTAFLGAIVTGQYGSELLSSKKIAHINRK